MAYPKARIAGTCTSTKAIVNGDGEHKGYSLTIRTEGGGTIYVTAWATDFTDAEIAALEAQRVELQVELGGRTFTNKDGETRAAVQATLVDIKTTLLPVPA